MSERFESEIDIAPPAVRPVEATMITSDTTVVGRAEALRSA